MYILFTDVYGTVISILTEMFFISIEMVWNGLWHWKKSSDI